MYFSIYHSQHNILPTYSSTPAPVELQKYHSVCIRSTYHVLVRNIVVNMKRKFTAESLTKTSGNIRRSWHEARRSDVGVQRGRQASPVSCAIRTNRARRARCAAGETHETRRDHLAAARPSLRYRTHKAR
jgi:hypothetical protein